MVAGGAVIRTGSSLLPSSTRLTVQGIQAQAGPRARGSPAHALDFRHLSEIRAPSPPGTFPKN